jgi:alkylated DNA nucleotide flippase Atl1
VHAIPPGRVAAYSDITPHAPRQAGRVLSRSLDPQVPWHRVVRADGTLAKGRRQAELLAAEGVPVVAGRVDMARFRL